MDGPELSIEDVKYCAGLVEENAKDLYLADLLLPDSVRSAVSVLHAFHIEVANVSLSTNEPMAGEIRLRWWEEVFCSQRPGEAMGHPVARPLLTILQHYSLPVASFTAKVEAHIFDLYNDPMGDRTAFEAYCGETRSCMFQWAALASGVQADSNLANASGHAGVAMGIVTILENLNSHRQAGKVFIPSDLLQATGIDPAGLLEKIGPKHRELVAGLVDYGRDHLAKAMLAIDNLQPDQKAVFKPLALAPLYFNRAASAPADVYQTRKPISQIRRQWVLWRF